MYDWSEEHQAIIAVVRRFVDEEIRPHLDDLEHNGVPPYEILRKMYVTFGLKEMAQESFARQLKRKMSGDETTREDRSSDPAAQLISTIELCRVSPGLLTSLGVSTGLAAGTINKLGTPAQMERWSLDLMTLDKIGAWAITEPDSGSDALGGMRTSAKRDGDEYVINGAKIYTSLAGGADYIWLATRTDPEVSKHKGISMFIVPMDTPGIRVGPMHLMGTHNIHSTCYEDVRVPAANLVGGENNGWTLITNQLNHERVTLCSPGIIDRSLADVRAWAQSTKLPDGRRVIDQQWVQEHLARVRAELEYLRLINWKVAWQATQGRLDVADASSIKVFGTEFYLRAFRLLMEVIGQAAYLQRDSPGAVLAGRLEMYARSMIILTFGGGTNEIQRDLIAIFGLGMPRSLR